MCSPWALVLGVLCILLVFAAGTLSVAHVHADGIVHADCNLCGTAHNVVSTTVAPGVASAAVVRSAVPQPLPPVRARRLATFALYTRPPPAV